MFTRTRSGWAAAIPSSSSRTTSAGSLISFFIAPPLRRSRRYSGMASQSKRALGHEGADDAADHRTRDRDPRVPPVRIALARDRQDEVHDARAEISRRVDRVSGRAAQRQADPEDEQGHEERPERPEDCD